MTATRLARVLAALAGALTVFGYAPFAVAGLPLATLAGLFWLWQHASRPRDAAALGFCFGLGLFGAGVSWVFIALETFGGMAPPLAAIATAGLVAFLAVYPAVAGWLAVRFTPASSASRPLAAAAAFVLAEWLRGFLFTGFPWLAVGYSQPPGSPLAGYAPVGGVWLVSLVVALAAALFALGCDAAAASRRRVALACAAGIAALFAGGATVGRMAWTTPAGAPLAVSLVQGNIAQELKFDPTTQEATFARYRELAAASRGRLIVLPESAFPQFAHDLPADLLRNLAAIARLRGGDLLFGVFTVEPPLAGETQPRIHNSVVSVGTGPVQVYRKRHLVPFGETIPARPLVGFLIHRVLAIPLSDQAAGSDDQPPFAVAGTRVAVNICYEDAFGAELRAGARAAAVLVNVTNDAWYGRSIAARQHNQIAAMRSLELGRPLLRATNTGITSAIDHRGHVVAELPWFTTGVLEVDVVGQSGLTPYVRFGDLPALALALALFAAAALRARRFG